MILPTVVVAKSVACKIYFPVLCLYSTSESNQHGILQHIIPSALEQPDVSDVGATSDTLVTQIRVSAPSTPYQPLYTGAGLLRALHFREVTGFSATLPTAWLAER